MVRTTSQRSLSLYNRITYLHTFCPIAPFFTRRFTEKQPLQKTKKRTCRKFRQVRSLINHAAGQTLRYAPRYIPHQTARSAVHTGAASAPRNTLVIAHAV